MTPTILIVAAAALATLILAAPAAHADQLGDTLVHVQGWRAGVFPGEIDGTVTPSDSQVIARKIWDDVVAEEARKRARRDASGYSDTPAKAPARGRARSQ
jgi:hypothetical protein